MDGDGIEHDGMDRGDGTEGGAARERAGAADGDRAGGGFSADEAARLERLRERAEQHGEYAEYAAIERRLRFMRWLVETGRIAE